MENPKKVVSLHSTMKQWMLTILLTCWTLIGSAQEPDSVVPIHRHQKTSETVVCLRGRVVEEYYDEQERICTETIELTPNGLTVALNIPPGQWHTIRSLESGSVILEVKDGKFEPLSDVDILQK